MPIERGEIERREGTEESFEEETVTKERLGEDTPKEEKSFFTAIIEFFKRLWGR